jgi:hypothetical protein
MLTERTGLRLTLVLGAALAGSACTQAGGTATGTSTGTAGTTGSGSGGVVVVGTGGSSSSGAGGSSSGGTGGATTSSGGTSSGSGSTTGSSMNCSPPLASPIYIDGAGGTDGPCCGTSRQAACLTVGQAMANVASAQVNGATLEAFTSTHVADWPAPESWPVTLGLGITLHAPGIQFYNSGSSSLDLFQVQKLNPSDIGSVAIQGDPGNLARIGFDSAFRSSGTKTALSVNGDSLSLQNVWLAGTVGLQVGPSALGASQPGWGVARLGPGPVMIGSVGSGLAGQLGVTCTGEFNRNSQVTEQGTTPVLAIEGQATGISVGDFCDVVLTQGDSIGPALSGGSCPTKVDGVGI